MINECVTLCLDISTQLINGLYPCLLKFDMTWIKHNTITTWLYCNILQLNIFTNIIDFCFNVLQPFNIISQLVHTGEFFFFFPFGMWVILDREKSYSYCKNRRISLKNIHWTTLEFSRINHPWIPRTQTRNYELVHQLYRKYTFIN